MTGIPDKVRQGLGLPAQLVQALTSGPAGEQNQQVVKPKTSVLGDLGSVLPEWFRGNRLDSDIARRKRINFEEEFERERVRKLVSKGKGTKDDVAQVAYWDKMGMR